ncbi:hypothetical protein DPMN_004226 [Dreissena polymorpha]|uniref:Uncharacterized protein n=1 Tax=Dreissena polymorpha TaxID=45954 RepID=A0A9D4MR86_DREPO|nr:hypothetical protein DPMN_004226 [Dreissena polymorpha]
MNKAGVTALEQSMQSIGKTNYRRGYLVTLSRDGIVISKLNDPAMRWSAPFQPGLHVTDSGQVLVCGESSRQIFQMGRDGSQKLEEVVKRKNKEPLSVFFSKRTWSFTMGVFNNNSIMGFKAQ